MKYYFVASPSDLRLIGRLTMGQITDGLASAQIKPSDWVTECTGLTYSQVVSRGDIQWLRVSDLVLGGPQSGAATSAAAAGPQSYPPKRTSFWLLWLKCTVWVFVIRVTIGFLSGGSEGLAFAIGAGLVLAPLSAFVLAPIIYFIRRPSASSQPATIVPAEAAAAVACVVPAVVPPSVAPPSLGRRVDDLYAQIGAELRTGQTDDAAWARALAESGGDSFRAKSLYAQYRFEALSSNTSGVPAPADSNRSAAPASAAPQVLPVSISPLNSAPESSEANPYFGIITIFLVIMLVIGLVLAILEHNK